MRLRFAADEPETEGRYAISVATVPANEPGTTPHVHREHDDITFVVDGVLAFDTDGDRFEAPAGTLVIIPRGLTHRWSNVSAEPATFLNIHIPGSGFESFVRELVDSPAGAMAEIGRRHDVYFDERVLRSRYSA